MGGVVCLSSWQRTKISQNSYRSSMERWTERDREIEQKSRTAEVEKAQQTALKKAQRHNQVS